MKPSRVEEFRGIYSWKGEWAKLFGASEEYQGTVLLQDSSDPLVFVVINHWAGRHSFARFREQFGPECGQLDEQCRGLTEEDTLIGTFTDDSV